MPTSFISRSNTSEPDDLDPRIADAKKKLYAATDGRATALQNDPYQKSVMEYLQGVVGGKNVPYTDQVKNSMLAQNGRGTADAEAAQMEALRSSIGASGGSIYDPGYQAAMRQAMSQRQGANLDAAGELNATAGLANNKAQMQGASQLASARNAQNAQVNQMALAGANYHAQEFAEKPPTTVQPAARKPPTVYNPMNLPENSLSAQNQAVFSRF